MQKVGILTFHRAHNYGAVLQCYALQQFLISHGFQVNVIDYRQRWVDSVYKIFSIFYVLKRLFAGQYREVIDYLRKTKSRYYLVKTRKRTFESFSKRLKLTQTCSKRNIPSFDIYVIGSDQLWSYECAGGRDEVYLGYFKRPSQSTLIGYAISCDRASLLDLKSELNDVISNFNKLSVRELSNSKLISEITNIQVPVTIDPTLLVNNDVWDGLVNHKWREIEYVAVYQVRSLPGQLNALNEKANVLAQKYNCSVVNIDSSQHSVEDFLSIIKYAKCIITTSFHAVAFAAIFKTYCYAVRLGDGKDDRYVNLLERLGLARELVDLDFEPIIPEFQFSDLDEKIKQYKKESEVFLKSLYKQ